jgi:competence protein ComEA
MDDRRKLEIAGWALAAFVLVLLAARVLHDDDDADAAPIAVPTATSASKPAPQKLLVVDVEGEVRRPGLTRVAAGSRVDAAVRQAGGLTRRADPAGVNLAAPVQDGQQVLVPRLGAARVAGPDGSVAPGGPPGAAPAAPISLSTATVEQLDTLDGIGPTLAQRIVEYREAHGGFRSIDELKQVDGIGEKRFESLKAGLQP